MSNDSFADMLELQAQDFAARCVSCGECLEACPVFPLTACADKGSEAVMEKIVGLLKTGDITDDAYDMIFSCSRGCSHHCMKACPEGLMPNLVFMHAVSRIRQSGKDLPPLAYQINPEHPSNFKHVFSALQEVPSDKRLVKELSSSPEPVDVVLFGGCSAHGMPHLLSETMGILDAMGVRFAALDAGDRCCGVGHVVCGEADKAQAAGKKLVADIAAFQPETAVFYCLGCYLVIAGTLAMSMDIPFALCDLTTFLADNMDAIPFKNSLDKRVAFHDSCVVSAMPDYAEKPRKLLKAIPGLSLKELKHNRDQSQCCGGVAKIMNPPIAETMRKQVLTEAGDTDIDILATFCAGCHENFSPHENELGLTVKNFISLIAESVGVGCEDRFKHYATCGDLKQIISEAGKYIDAAGFTPEEMKRILPEYLHQLLPEK